VPDTREYLNRIREYAAGRDPLELQEQTAGVLAELLAAKSDQQLRTRPSPDKWSIAEILAHLADDEISSAWRYRQMVEHNGIELAGFDQEPAPARAGAVGVLRRSRGTWPNYRQESGSAYGGSRRQSRRANPQDFGLRLG
jgi:hypothetical protein